MEDHEKFFKWGRMATYIVRLLLQMISLIPLGPQIQEVLKGGQEVQFGSERQWWLILNDGRWDGEMDEFRAKCALMWTGLRCGEDIEDEDQGNGKNYV